ncbi:lysophospholipid acyltransferase family protein [Dietzia timorensis]|uniref:1-acyl-sn-glycerol-3-phosphate acyltransferase n=1 Tax=Dietzia timorensis TaxID=499555 RepID=A0A173LHV1_9ACTN|nr:1-acyl-sn-glycerol-3-phosphate acyltransferase [Dietzia timorensis]ANI91031.1 1-acyl-sn-glycerol-3-phosphate acyltransferase [Dietzia timorensis]
MAFEPLYQSIIGIARAMFFAQGLRIELTGEKNFPKTGGAVVVINHTGYMDFVYAGVPAREYKRFIRFMAKKEVFDHKIAGPIMRNLRHIPVDRTGGGDAYAAAVEALRRGELIGVFPEATISRSFEIKGFKTGGARMAQEAGVPILPVTIWGSQRVWSKGLPKNMVRPSVPILIDTAEPVYVTGDPAEFMENLRESMQANLERLQDRYVELAGPYPQDASWVPRRLGGSAPTLEEANVLDEAEHQARMEKKQRSLGDKRGESAGSGDSQSGPTTGNDGGEAR